MTWFTAALTGAAAALALLLVAFAWLVARRRFAAAAMSSGEAGRLLAQAGHRAPVVAAKYANARGKEWTAHAGIAELRHMLAHGRWREAAPWLLLAGGVALAFPFWPFLMLQLVGVPGPLAGVAALGFLGVAVRTLRLASAPTA